MSILCALPLGMSHEGSPLVSPSELSLSAHMFRSTASVHYFDLGATSRSLSPSPPPQCAASAPPTTALPTARIEAYQILSRHGFAVDETRAPYDEEDMHVQELTQMLDTTAGLGGSSLPVTPTRPAPTHPTTTTTTAAAPTHNITKNDETNNINNNNTVSSTTLSVSPAASAGAPASSGIKAPSAAEESASEPSAANASVETTPCGSPTRSCLRTWPSSPTSPTLPLSPTRKRLSWADQGGCDLVAAMPFMRDDEPWRCARSGRRVPALFASAASLPFRLPASFLEPLGPVGPRPSIVLDAALPAHDRDLMIQLGGQGVQLESVLVRAPLVFCTVRVLNVAFEKSVTLRVTKDNWATSLDVQASYMPGSSDGRSDRFYASLSLSDQEAQMGLQFAICYRTPDREFWDNNGGQNYKLALAHS